MYKISSHDLTVYILHSIQIFPHVHVGLWGYCLAYSKFYGDFRLKHFKISMEISPKGAQDLRLVARPLEANTAHAVGLTSCTLAQVAVDTSNLKTPMITISANVHVHEHLLYMYMYMYMYVQLLLKCAIYVDVYSTYPNAGFSSLVAAICLCPPLSTSPLAVENGAAVSRGGKRGLGCAALVGRLLATGIGSSSLEQGAATVK